MTEEDSRALNRAMAGLCGYPVAQQTAPCPAGAHIHERTEGLWVYYANLISGAWSPVTNLAQALEVAEVLRKQGWNVFLVLWAGGVNACQLSYVRDSKPPGGRYGRERTGSTLAEAICSVAMETLETEVGE